MADETYRPDRLFHPPPPDPPLFDGVLRSGEGPPPASLGNPGDAYINLLNQNFYIYNNTGWHLTTGGGGGSIQVIAGAVDDPNGVVEPDETSAAAFYYKDHATNTILWKWSVTGQVWYQLLG